MTDIENDRLWNKYFYPGTEVLINNYGTKKIDLLKEYETTNSFNRLLELQDKPINRNFDKYHLIEIHKYIFEDVYPFAGDFRFVNMKKARGSFLTINTSQDIDRYLDELFEDVEKELMHCRSKHDFAELLSKIYTELIYCHPFREGNGRTIREFIREFSIAKSRELGIGDLELDWSIINVEERDKNIEFAHLFPSNTAILFEKALLPIESKSK